MKSSLLLLLFSLCLLHTACKDCDQADPLSEIPLGCWINAREEQFYADTLIYRPCDYQAEWPLSWYRNRFVLEENGVGSYLILHPADAHHLVDCTWEYDPDFRELSFLLNQSGEIVQYKVIQIEADKIVLTHY